MLTELLFLAHTLTAQIPEASAKEIANIQETIEQISDIARKNKIPFYDFAILQAKRQNINQQKFTDLINCESKWKANAKGDYSLEEDIYKANGLLQFWRSTWNVQADLYDFERKDFLDPYRQMELSAIMLSKKDGWKHWYNCYKWISK